MTEKGYLICEYQQKFSKHLILIKGGYNEMTKNSFENKALSSLAETCNAENGTYRGGDSAVGIWRVPCGESVAKMQIAMKGMKKVETEKSKPVFGSPAGSGNDASDASHAGFCGYRRKGCSMDR